MTGLDENKEVVDFVTRIMDLPKEERIKESLKMQVSTYLTVKSHDEKFKRMNEQIDLLPCHSNGLLRFMAAAGTVKRGIICIGGAVLAILTLIAAWIGVASYFKH